MKHGNGYGQSWLRKSYHKSLHQEEEKNPVDQSHLDRKYFIDRHVYNCPFCKRGNVAYTITKWFKFDWSNDKQCWGYLVRCTSCKNYSMHLSFSDTAGIAEGVYLFDDLLAEIDSRIFYSVPTSFFTIDSRIPETIRELITEAEGSLKMNFLTGASACMRKAIYELLVCEEEDSSLSYEDRIKSLKDKYPSIPSALFDILSGIQQMTSDKVHEQSWDEWDSPNLKLIIETLKGILYEIYVRPQEQRQQMNQIKQLQAQVKGKQEESG